jgi:DNA-binding NarL/FixJ family response regulator
MTVPAASPIRVLLVDDQPLLRTGFRMILETEPDIAVVGESGDGEAAVAAARALQPDVALMDVVVAPSVMRRLLDQFARRLPAANAPTPAVSETTMKTHVGNLLTKLGVRDGVQAVYAYESGLVRPGAL